MPWEDRVAIVHRPSPIVHRPSSIVHRPSSIVHRPSSIVTLRRKDTESLQGFTLDAHLSLVMSKLSTMPWEDRVAIVRRHFEKKGYRVHSGLQFGCELVLYADDPSRVHSDFCVHVVRPDGRLDWRTMQTLVRSMPDLHKTLILAHIREGEESFSVDEMAITTEHAPFRHKNTVKGVGSQMKKAKTDKIDEGDGDRKEEVKCEKDEGHDK